MRAIYKFEEEIIAKYGDDLEPVSVSYSVDELKEGDRREVSGMLWALNSVENYKNSMFDYEDESLLEKMVREIKEQAIDEAVKWILGDLRDFTVSCIDNYGEDEEE